MPQIRRTRGQHAADRSRHLSRSGMRQRTAARRTAHVRDGDTHVALEPLRRGRAAAPHGRPTTAILRRSLGGFRARAIGRLGFGQKPSWLISLAVHAALLTALALWSLTTVRDEPPVLLATVAPVPVELEDQLSAVDIAMPEPELAGSAETPFLEEPPDALPVDTPSPIPSRYVARHPLLQAGFDPLLEVVAAGGQQAMRSRPANRGGSGEGHSSFFGAPAQADRVVYLVDNSNSMVDGRFETALAELARSIDSLAAKQSFYVIFYSDAAYRLFHPHPAPGLIAATPQNKRRVRQWLGTVQTCTGGRVVDALELADSMDPQIVYLLSDGVMGDFPYRYLTDNQQRKYALHTIGMTVPNDDAAHKLAAIARQNRGMFRAVGIAGPARALARRRPIKKNRHRGAVWGINLPER